MKKIITSQNIDVWICFLVLELSFSACFQRGDSDTNIIYATTLAASPYSVPADGKTALQVTVNIGTALNIPTSNIAITLLEDTSTVAIEQADTYPIDGKFVAYLTSKTVGDFTIHAYVTLNGKQYEVKSTVIARFTLPPEHIQLIASPNSLTVDPNTSVEIRAIVQYTDGHPVANETIRFTSNVETDALLSTSLTDIQGEASTSFSSTVAGIHTIIAITQAAEARTSIVFTPAEISSTQCFIEANPSTITTSGNDYATITVTLKDAYGNSIPGIDVLLASSEATDIIAPMTATTDTLGRAIFTIAATVSGNHTLTANAQSIFLNLNLEVRENIDPNFSYIISDPNTLVADGNAQTTVTVYIRNKDNLPIESSNIAFDTLSVHDQVIFSSGNTTDANGMASIQITSTQVHTESIIAQLEQNKTLSTPVSFTVGAPDVLHSQISVSNSAIADGNDKNVATITVKDTQDRSILGQAVTFSVSGSSTTISNPTGLTDASGQFSSYFTTTMAQDENITVNVASNFNLTSPISFVAGPVASIFVSYEGTNDALYATNNLPFSATLYDAYANPVPNQLVTWSSSSSTGKILSDKTYSSTASGISNSLGISTINIRSDYYGINTITASHENFYQNNQQTLSPNIICTDMFAQNKFSSTTLSTPNISTPVEVVFRDFNEDGYPDLLTSAIDSNIIDIFLNNGDGSFPLLSTTSISTGYDAQWQVAIEDFNRDGILDLATISVVGINDPNSYVAIAIHFGNGDGTFQAPNTFKFAPKISQIYVIPITPTDLNNDGYMDIVIRYPNTSGILDLFVFINDGHGGLNPSTQYTVNSPINCGSWVITSGDLNHDGNQDLIVPCIENSTINVFLGNGDGTFQNQKIYSTDSYTYGVALADVNNDNNLDIITASALSNAINIYTGNGDGTFIPQQTFITCNTPISIMTSDINKDGFIDIACTCRSDNSIAIFYNDKSGGFITPFQTYETGSSPMQLALSDLNQDGWIDLSSANLNSQNITIYQQVPYFSTTLTSVPSAILSTSYLDTEGYIGVAAINSDANSIRFYRIQSNLDNTSDAYNVGNYPIDILATDFDHDGHADLAIANLNSNNIGILKSNGDGTFKNMVPTPVSIAPSKITYTDLNNDGNQDLIIFNSSQPAFITINGLGDGNFSSENWYNLATKPIDILARDLNADGHQDIIILSQNSNNVTIMLGNSNNSFASPITYPVGSDPVSMAIGDVNGDGVLDLAIANAIDKKISILLGSSSNPGSFGLSTQYFLKAPPKLIRIIDYNGDGKMDLAVLNEGKNYIHLLNGLGDGTFTVETRGSNLNNLDLLSVSKWNDIPILIVGSSESNKIEILPYACP